jgi:serine protease Do
MWSKQRKIGSIAGFILIGVFVGVILTANFEWTPRGFAAKRGLPVLGSQDQVPEALLQVQNTSKAFTIVSKEVLPTVVSVYTTKEVKVQRAGRQNTIPPMFRDFFGRDFQWQEPDQVPQKGLGSGVIVSKDGYVLTNNHVVKDADDIKVQMYDKRQFEAKLIGADPLTDVAVIKIEGKDFPVARLGDSDALEIGEWVLAVGNPLELSSTVTAGIVSAKGRNIHILDQADPESQDRRRGNWAIENFIQTDAAINPGNSGGALVNLHAEVIGINTAIATQTGGYMGYGFAIPINLARKVMSDLIEKGFVTRAWLGIAMKEVDDAVAQRFGMEAPQGVYVEEVMNDSPASKAGLKTFDIILKIDGHVMNSSNEVQNFIAMKKPGETVTLSLLRNGKSLNVAVKLGQRETGKAGAKELAEEEDIPKLGLTVQTLNNELKSQFEEYKDDEGALVTDVDPNSSAFDANIRKGDLITKIEDSTIQSAADYKKAIKSFAKGKVVIFQVKNARGEFHAFVKLPK